MKNMSFIKVTDVKTGELKRYEDEHGKVIATIKDGKLQVTADGADNNLVIRNNQIYEIGAEYPAV